MRYFVASLFYVFAVIAVLMSVLRWHGRGPLLRWRLFNLPIGWAGYLFIACAALFAGTNSLICERPSDFAGPYAVIWMLVLVFAALFGLVGDLVATHGNQTEASSPVDECCSGDEKIGRRTSPENRGIKIEKGD